MIETVEVSLRRLCDMDADFALAEGGNATLTGWREEHRRFFARKGGWAPDMLPVCERFLLVEDFYPGGPPGFADPL